ncbi:hypothetical protein COCVIDRAFT_111247, partial [Bipolaris victoriae FI3]
RGWFVVQTPECDQHLAAGPRLMRRAVIGVGMMSTGSLAGVSRCCNRGGKPNRRQARAILLTPMASMATPTSSRLVYSITRHIRRPISVPFSAQSTRRSAALGSPVDSTSQPFLLISSLIHVHLSAWTADKLLQYTTLND